MGRRTPLHGKAPCGCDVLSLSSDSIASSVGRRTSKPSGSAFFFFQSPQLLRAMASGAWRSDAPGLTRGFAVGVGLEIGIGFNKLI